MRSGYSGSILSLKILFLETHHKERVMKKSKIIFIIGSLVVLALSPSHVFAKYGHGETTLRVTIKNLTRGQIFSPPLVITHNDRFKLFETGEPASPELARLAEDGDTSGLINQIQDSPMVFYYKVADGPVLPGKSVTIGIPVNRKFNQVSLAGMLVTTNDGFVAVRGARIPFGKTGTTLHALAYDAGSEANSEDCAFIPGPPCGNGGVRDTDGAEGFVHVHAGIHGIADLLPERDDWRNPVADITIEYDDSY